MAKAPVSEEILKEKFGPHLNYKPPGGWNDESVHPPEKLVKTHCCFCGQQCGIQLKARDNRVIGFEPWELWASQSAGCVTSRRSMAKTQLPSMAAHRSRRRNPICWVNLPVWRWALVTSTTTDDCAWFLPERRTNSRSGSTEAQFRGVRSPKRRYCL